VRHILVLGDQLTRQHGPLAAAQPDSTVVLTVESVALVRRTRAHKAKIALFFSALRRFAAELAAEGFRSHHHRLAPSFEAAIAHHLADYPGVTLELLEPADRGVAAPLSAAARAHGGDLRILPNPLRLVDADTFDAWARGRKRWRMEDFYRFARSRAGILMDPERPGEPLGGVWNLDHANRERAPQGLVIPPSPRFVASPIVAEVLADIDAHFAEHPGRAHPFAYPTTRSEALGQLDHFVRVRLPAFGPYEDALLHGERQLFHSQLSIPLNLGLLHPREVLDAALARFSDGSGEVPLASIEGFVRQILGWREYMFHVDRVRGPQLEHANVLGHRQPVPEAFWSGDTRMACVRDAWSGLEASGYNHHIERLMIFGNLALGLGVDPVELRHWFTAMYVDALDWVMVPNVMGMSQYADGGGFTSKPYLSGGAYLKRMSDHCRRCPFDPGARSGEHACPFTVGYWDFVDRHQERFARHPRMAVVVKAWRERPAAEQAAVRARAEELRQRLP
jgi:deoxyribodipyrimidine photolyase-related protein